MKNFSVLCTLLCCSVSLGACSKTTSERLSLPPLATVAQVDVDRYMGTWYEIASFPQSFQEGYTGTTATYKARENGELDVLNRCYLESLEGELDEAHGRARVVDTASNAKLEVSFFRPFWGDYWIIELGNDYQYAVVGHPSRDYLWILSRTSQMHESLYKELIVKLRAKGYETDRLVKTLQAQGSGNNE